MSTSALSPVEVDLISRFAGPTVAGRAPADRYFPVAHTCFFTLELPAYSSAKLMRERLRYAIYNCEDIDGDETATGDHAFAMARGDA